MQKEGSIAKAINRISNVITKFSERVEKVEGKTPERIAVVLYCIGHILVCLFHEPWFDEALSWLIARDSSIQEILFITPHFEGHPSLWYLILLPLVKLGAPYELSLNLISLFFGGLAVSLFVYKSTFKRIVRLTVPFTYYLFYQYGVICRPYCMMLLAFVLIAITFKHKDEKPGRFVLSLWFLCLTSAYGIVLAGGICISWLTEMLILAYRKSVDKNTDNGENRSIFKIFIEDYLLVKGKILWLCGLLAYVIFIIWRIIPAGNTFASLMADNTVEGNGLGIRLIYTLFASVSDLFVTNVFYTSGTLLKADIYAGELIAAAVIGAGIIIAIIILCLRTKEKAVSLIYFLVPYLFLTIFEATVYLYYHHIGITLLFIGFFLWEICSIEKTTPHKKTGDSMTILHDFGKIALALMIIIPIYWTISSCISEGINSYGSGRKQYEFMKEHGLDEGYTILTDWYKMFDAENVPEGYAEYDLIFSQQGVNLAPYLKKNKIINSPNLIGKSYAYLHEIPDRSTETEIFNKLADFGEPDIIIGTPEIKETMESLNLQDSTGVDYNDYVKVFSSDFGNIKKGVSLKTNVYIYVRKDLAEKLGLVEWSKND